jgi:hypothetical protein
MPTVINMSSQGEAIDASTANSIESGKSPQLVLVSAVAMKLGATKPISVAVAGPAVVLRPYLKRLAPELEGQRLPYLTVLFIGPVELEAEARALVETRGATFRFISYSEHTCGTTQ